MGFFYDQAELESAVADVAALSPAARKVLASVIEHQEKSVTKVSPSAELLEDLGFIFIRNRSFFDGSAVLNSSLWGEEALDEYENRKALQR